MSSSEGEEDLAAYYEEGESEQTISTMLETVFTPEEEPETKKMKLDEETFEPVTAPGMKPIEPTEAEISKHPELEYTDEEVKKVVSGMTKEQKDSVQELEQYFLTRYRQTGNIKPLRREVREIVKEMCPSMPGQMQEAVIEARAQLLAEAKLKELCKQLNIPMPVIPPSPIIHPIDEALLGDKATPITPMEGREKEKGSESIAQRQQETYLTGEGPSRRIGPVKMELEGDIKPKQLLSTQYLPDTMLQAMEGQVDDELEVIRIKRGRDPFYDLTKGDEDLKEACALITEDLLPSHEDDVHIDDLSVASCDTYGEVDVEEAKSLLVKLAESKAKEAEILRDLAVVVSAEDLTPRQIGGIAKEVVQQEMVWPEIKYITDEYDYQGHPNDSGCWASHAPDL